MRSRRIAADEAHAWARNLRLGNPYAKLVLSMLTIYVNGEGACFVGIGALAEDCELATETVRRRLAWLESIGAVLRVPQWLDEHGRRNSDGRGKRTTDEIRLLVNADAEEIERNAANKGPKEPGEENSPPSVSPVREGGTNPDQDSISPLLATSLGTGANALNLNQEVSPPSPLKRGVKDAEDSIGEKRTRQLAKVYPDPITNWNRTRAELAVLADSDFEACLTGAKGYAAYLERERQRRRGRSRTAKNAHIWVKNGEWIGFIEAGEKADAAADAPKTYHPMLLEGRAILALARIARFTPLVFKDGTISYRHPITLRLLAMADSPGICTERFQAGTQNFGAWVGFIRETFAGYNLPRLTEVCVPWPWPPRADGTIYSGTDPPLVPGTLATEDDLVEFSKG